MAAKPRKKEPTLAELLAQYGRNIASDAPVVGRRIVEGVRSLPEMADTGSRFALGAAQRLGDMLPPELRGPALRGDYRTTFDAGADIAQLLGRTGNQLVTGTSQRGLDAMGAPRGAGYDPGATRMSRGAQDAIVSGAQALPKQMYDSPLSTAYEAALMAAPIPGKMVGRALEGAGALAGRAMRGRRAAPLAAAVEDVAPMPQKITFPDEGQWELPDLTEEVSVYTAPVERPKLSVPARPIPAREKVGVYHGTPHRLTPEMKVRDTRTGEERIIEKIGTARKGKFGAPRLITPFTVPPDVEVLKDYPLGRFRMDKIGTGEGAQAYGHGLYFAEAPDVARGYRQSLSNSDLSSRRVNNQSVGKLYDQIMTQANAASNAQAQPLYDRLALLDDLIDKGDTLAIRQNLEIDPNRYSPSAVDWFEREVEKGWDAPGSLYRADLDIDPARMLAWDQTLLEQPETTRALMPLLQKYEINDAFENGKYPMLGGDIYHRLRLRSDARDQAVSDMLTGAGIPGIRYLDQGSRNSGGATENYVMMNPDLIEIKKRYAVGGAVSGRSH